MKQRHVCMSLMQMTATWISSLVLNARCIVFTAVKIRVVKLFKCYGRIPTFRMSMLPPSSLHKVITQKTATWTIGFLMRDLRFSRRWKFELFWVVTPCSVVVGYQRFWGSMLLSSSLQGIITQKTATWTDNLFLMRDLRFSRRWKFELFWVVTTFDVVGYQVSKIHAAFIFSTRYQNPKELDLNLILKPSSWNLSRFIAELWVRDVLTFDPLSHSFRNQFVFWQTEIFHIFLYIIS